MQLELHNVSVDRGPRTIVSEISLKLQEGEALTLKGPNGVGKTTLIRAIAGFLSPSAGTITLTGTSTTDATIGENAHYVGHLDAIKPTQTVWENLKFWSSFYDSANPEESCDHAITAFNLEDLTDIPSGYLSAGQKRRLSLARLLTANRKIWLLDEPTVSLDTASTQLVASAVESHTQAGGMAIAATHIPLGIAKERELILGAVHQ